MGSILKETLSLIQYVIGLGALILAGTVIVRKAKSL